MNLSKIPLFDNSVRVFFPLTALIAVLVPMYTVTVIVNNYPFSNEFFHLFQWHGHQMLFGFFYTLTIGFTLTAGAHWTKQKPVHGYKLLALLFLWIIDQVFLYLGSNIYFLITSSSLLGVYFFVLLFETLKNYPQRMKFLLLTSAFSALKVLFLLTKITEISKDTIYDFVTILIIYLAMTISGRVLPNFTKNFFKDNHNYTPPQSLNKSSELLLLSLFLVPFIKDEFTNFFLFSATGSLFLIKIYWYNSLKALKTTLIGMLHFGYITLCLSLIVTAFSFYNVELNHTKAMTHFILTAGVSIIALNIMIRATLGHTGRKLRSSISIKLMYFFVVLGALIRVIIPVFWPDYFTQSLHHSMGHWTLAFLIYLITHAHMCFKKRVDS